MANSFAFLLNSKKRIGKKMKTEMSDQTQYTPPPPPPTPHSSRKILLVAIIVAIVVVAFLGFYFMSKGTNNSNFNSQTSTSPNPSSNSPSSTHTPTPSPQATNTQTTNTQTTNTQTTNTQTTNTPSASNGAVTNFRVGAHASYILTSYGDSTTTTIPIDLSIDQGTYNGTSCWLMIQTTTLNQSGTTMKTVFTYYMSKTSLQAIHYHIQTYNNGVLVNDQEENPISSPSSSSGLQEVDPNTVISHETITVAAGTFTNCAKAQTTTDSGVTSVWIHSSVPVWGIVKTETTSTDGQLTSSMELQSYGG